MNYNMKIKAHFIAVGIIAILAVIAIILAVSTSLSYTQSLRIIFGSAYVLFLPGFIISFIFFPRTKNPAVKEEKGAIDWIERTALSFALSIAIVPLVVFYLNLMGIKINLLNSFLTILGITFISIGILILEKLRSKESK